jgi:Uma2 family endonuclease
MAQALSKLLTFEEFLAWYPEHGGRYELLEGEIVEMRPVGQHECIASFIDAEFTLEIRRLQSRSILGAVFNDFCWELCTVGGRSGQHELAR